MKRNIKSLFTSVIAVALSLSVSAQTLNSSYFMTEMTGRHRLNPALKTSKHYIGMPALNDIYVGVNSNTGVGAYLYPQGDKLVTFLHESVPADKFLNKLAENNAFETDLGIDLLSFGFWAWGGQNTFDLSVKSSTGFYVPKGLFQFLKTGQESTGVTQYELGNITLATNNYVELALGHAHDINNRLSIGARAKLLLGAGYGEMKIDQMSLSMSRDEWYIKEHGSMVVSPLIETEVDPETGKIENVGFANNFGVQGYGFGLDVGASYKLLDNLTLSASVTDIGFMQWNNLVSGESDPENEFRYTGFDNIGAEDDANGNNAFDESVNQLEDDLASLLYFYDSGTKSISRPLRSTLRVGAEYSILREKISFGLLSTTRFIGENVYAEGMAAINFRPFSALHITLNGSYSNMGGCSFGGVINVCAPGFNFFVGTDFIAGNYTKQFVPIDRAHVNACVGLSFTFGKKHKL